MLVPILYSLLGLSIGLLLLCFVLIGYSRYRARNSPSNHVCVLVLGDIGRSPRMKYHTLSLAKHGLNVDLVGMPGAQVARELLSNPLITIHHLKNEVGLSNSAVGKALKAARQTWVLFKCLMSLPHFKILLMQNPPAIPSLPIARIVCWIRGTNLVVDMHNYAFTLMSLSFGPKHPIVLIAKLIEKLFVRTANQVMCVSKAMRQDLIENWGLQDAVVFYDMAPSRFVPITNTHEKQGIIRRIHASGALEGLNLEWLEKLRNSSLEGQNGPAIVEDSDDEGGIESLKINSDLVSGMNTRPDSSFERRALLKRILGSGAESVNRANSNDRSNPNAPRYQQALAESFFPDSLHKKGMLPHNTKSKPFLIVSSTSWTKDEDFSILFKALVALDRAMCMYDGGYSSDSTQSDTIIPKMEPRPVLCVVTGSGELKEYYQALFRAANLKHVQFVSAWLTVEDYPKLLACANVGVSLHNSSSGVDLPMKVVDMFGVNLPVLAHGFKALPELVEDGVTGEIFNSTEELTTKLANMMNSQSKIQKMRSALEQRRSQKDWDLNWNLTVKRIFLPPSFLEDALECKSEVSKHKEKDEANDEEKHETTVTQEITSTANAATKEEENKNTDESKKLSSPSSKKKAKLRSRKQ